MEVENASVLARNLPLAYLTDITRDCGSDVGACQKGTELCTEGTWGNCTGAIGPVNEACNDGQDNDCDTYTDCDDSDCDGDPACPDCLPKGAACTEDAECCSGDCLPAGKCK